MNKIAKIESFLKELEKINTEIIKRDLSKVSFRDLLTLKQSIERSLKIEVEKIRYLTGEFTDLLPDITGEKYISLDLKCI